jgi:hypothetical protein
MLLKITMDFALWLQDKANKYDIKRLHDVVWYLGELCYKMARFY